MDTRPMRYANRARHTAWVLFLGCLGAAVLATATPGASSYVFAQTTISESDRHTLVASPYIRTDFIMTENNVDLDTKKRDDRVQYIAIDYAIPFDLKIKDDGPEIFFQLRRNGMYDYDAPVIIHNTLNTYMGKVSGYKNAELLPKVKEYWADIPVAQSEGIRFKAGLFKYEVGHGISLNGSYENYGMELYTKTEGFRWNVYACWPDIANKQLLGPYIKQEKPQMVDYFHTKSYFVSTDVRVSTGNMEFQPYVGLLMDFSEGKRMNLFQTPTRDDILGTAGIAWYLNIDKFSLSAEWARNFGHANSSQPEAGFSNVEHRGYAVYADASYSFGKFKPNTRFIFASGNKLTTDMIANGDTLYPGSKNNAFSVYSPMNAYLADSIYPSITTLPIVSMGNGYAMNYGVLRPGTFRDPAQIENMVMAEAGFEYSITDKAAMSFEWWYMANAQKGIGMYNNVPKVVSPELGTEIDLFFDYSLTKNLILKINSGIFFPGAAFMEERDDVNGSLFTPFVRGDGKADPAYQLEVCMEVHF